MKTLSFNHARMFAALASAFALGLNGCADSVAGGGVTRVSH